MKKQLFKKSFCVLVIMSIFLNITAQTAEENLKKYWNYRDKFQKQFVKIGALPGNGINFAAIDNNPANKDYGWPRTTVKYGYRKTGDAMNDQGSYISVLATPRKR